MASTSTRPSPTTPDHSSPADRVTEKHGRLLAVLLLGLALITLGAILGWIRLQAGPQSSLKPSPTVPAGAGGPYAPGGSIYNDQVPAAARSADAYGPGSPYAPGGSVWNEQVPAAARLVVLRAPFGPGEHSGYSRTPTTAREGGGYTPGGSVYQQQVPNS